MKNLIFLLFLISLLGNCTYVDNNDEQIIAMSLGEELSGNLKNFDSYLIYGNVHNAYLETIVNKHIYQGRKDTSEFLNYTKSIWVQTNIKGTELDEEVNILFDSGVYGYNYLYSNNLKEALNSENIKENIRFLKNNLVIDEFEYLFLTNFALELDTISSFHNLLIKTNQYISLWNDQQYMENTTDGDFSAIILAITKQSTEWWLENEEFIGSQSTQRAIPWLALDAAGALVSGTISAVAIYQIEGSCCGNAWAVGAVGAGVAASTGLIGKVAKGIAWLFP